MEEIKDNLLKDKAIRLGSAIYLVTKYLADSDPLKWKMRQIGLSLISDSETFKLDAVLNDIADLLSFIELALISQTASTMNFTLLKKATLSIKELVLKEQKALNPLEQSGFYSAESHSSFSRPSTVVRAPSAKPGPDSSRREQIISLIRQKGGWSSIKEIAQAVPNFSSKTVQRELAELVRVGRLKKAGNRRWSRYLVDD